MRAVTRFVSLCLVPAVFFLPLSAQVPQQTGSGPEPGVLQIKVVDRDAPELRAGSHAQKGFTLLVTDAAGNPVSDAAVVFRLPDSAPTGTLADGSHSAVLYTGRDGRVQIPNIQWGTAAGAVSIHVTANKGTAHAGMLIEQDLAPAATTQTAPAVSVSTPQQAKLKAPGKVASPAEDPAILTPQPRPAIATPDQQPQVSISGPPASEKIHSGSKKKWIILAVVAAGAAGAAGFAMKGKSSSSSSSNSSAGLSIGSPTISVGQP